MTKLDEVIQLVQTTIHMGKASRFMVLEDIVTKLKSNINTALNEDGWSILHIAVYQHDQLNMLRRNSFSLMFLQNSTSELRENSFKLIELLIKCNANVNLLDKYGRPPIFFAASQEVSDFLIKAGAAVFFQNLEFSALHVQCFLEKKHFDPFLQDNLSASKRDVYGKLPLHLALCCKKITFDEIVSLVNCAPESTESCDNEKIYPLGYAALYASEDILHFILENSSTHVIETTYEQIDKNIICLDGGSSKENGALEKHEGTSIMLSAMSDEKNQIKLANDSKEENRNVLSAADKLEIPFHPLVDKDELIYKEYLAPPEYLDFFGGGKKKNKKEIVLKKLEANREKYSKIEDSMLIRENLEKKTFAVCGNGKRAKEQMSFFEKKIKFADFETLKQDFNRFLIKISAEDIISLRAGDEFRVSDDRYFRIDIVNRENKENRAWVVQLQDNTGQGNKLGNKSLSAVFAIVCIPKSYEIINGSELSRLLADSYQRSEPIEVPSIRSLRFN